MEIPFTVAQFTAVFADYNVAVWPVQWFLFAMACGIVAALLKKRAWTDVCISLILGALWAWNAVAYHLAFFSHISPAAYVFSALSMTGAAVFIWEGVVRQRMRFQWPPGLRCFAGVALIVFALMAYPIWCAAVGHAYPLMPTFGLPCPTTIFTIGVLCFEVRPTPRDTLIAPVLWCLVGAQAAWMLDMQPDLSLIPAALVGLVLLFTAGHGKHDTLQQVGRRKE
jgi:hypothetical protein